MTTAERTLPKQAPSLDQRRRSDITGKLNECLATMIDLAASAKQAHWNVRGPNFAGLHGLFDTIAEESRAWADLLAERCVTLGGTAHGTLHQAAGRTRLGEFPADERQWEPLAREMHRRMSGCGSQVREVAGGLDDELATQDMLIEILRGLEMRSWMLEAHLG